MMTNAIPASTRAPKNIPNKSLPRKVANESKKSGDLDNALWQDGQSPVS